MRKGNRMSCLKYPQAGPVFPRFSYGLAATVTAYQKGKECREDPGIILSRRSRVEDGVRPCPLREL